MKNPLPIAVLASLWVNHKHGLASSIVCTLLASLQHLDAFATI